MKILVIILSLFLSLPLIQAQNKTINEFYRTHRQGDNAIGIRVPGWVVQAGINLSVGKDGREELKPFRPFLRRLTNMRVLAVDGDDQLPKGTVKAFVNKIKQQNFNTLTRIKDDGTHVEILVGVKERGPKKKRRKIVKNILVLVQDEGEMAVITINGHWDMNQVNQLLNDKQMRELIAWN
ncbi:MAG: DUF4252 domain-containing protein [Aureispira sp.]